MTRNETDFVSGTVDQLLLAINDARRYAQRKYNFRRLRTEGFLQTSMLGAVFTTAYPTPVVSAPSAITVKLIEKVYNYTTRSVAAGTLYERTAELDYRRESELYKSLPMSGVGTTRSPNTFLTMPTAGRSVAWTKGQKLFINSESLEWYLLDIVEQKPDLIGTETSDFFIDNAPDWLLFKSIQMLNGYLKEDHRVAISQRALEDSWETFTQFDSDVDNANDAVDLD